MYLSFLLIMLLYCYDYLLHAESFSTIILEVISFFFDHVSSIAFKIFQ
jgi:hypothetical protein